MKLYLASLATLSLLTLTPALRAEEHHAADHKETHDEEHPAPAHKEAHADHMLEGYAAVSTALYKDDLAGAKKAAAGMVKHDKDSAMAKHCQGIADSKTIEEARQHFKELSDLAIPIAKKAKTMHVMHCPMAFDNKGADWLQASAEEVQNPYFGAKMAHCGHAVK